MNYDIFKGIGSYDADTKKSTTVTYEEGRMHSEEIEKIQTACRAKELASKSSFTAIDAKYMTEEGSLKPIKANAVPVTTKMNAFGGHTAATPEALAEKLDSKETVSLNWRDEFGGDEDVPDMAELEALFMKQAENGISSEETEESGASEEPEKPETSETEESFEEQESVENTADNASDNEDVDGNMDDLFDDE